jgi:acetyltransferase
MPVTRPALVHLRPLAARDGAAFARFVEGLSAESRNRRFLGPKPRLTAKEVAYLTDVDGVRHGAFAAIDPRTGAIVGEARYAPWPGRESVADIAVTVADELQGRRIGTSLAGATVEAARVHGVRTLTASTLWENVPARALLRRLGFRPIGSGDGVVELELELELATAAARPAPVLTHAPAAPLAAVAAGAA